MVGILAVDRTVRCMFLKSVLDMQSMVWVEELSCFGLGLGVVCRERRG